MEYDFLVNDGFKTMLPLNKNIYALFTIYLPVTSLLAL